MASTILIRVCAFILNRTPFLDAITLLFLAGELSQYRGLMKLTSFEIYAYATATALAGAFLGFGTPRIRSICAKVYSAVLLFTCFGIYSRKTLHPAEHVAARSVTSCIGAVATFLYYAALIDRSESTRLAMAAAQKQQNSATEAATERASKHSSQKADDNNHSGSESESESESDSVSNDEGDQKSNEKSEQATPETTSTNKVVKPTGEPAVYTLSNIFIVIYCILNAYAFFYITEQRHALTYHIRLLCPQLGPPLSDIVDLLPSAISLVYLCIGLLLGSDRRPLHCVTLLIVLTVCAQCLVDCNFKYFHNRGGVPFWLHFRKLVDDGIVLISLLLRRRYA